PILLLLGAIVLVLWRLPKVDLGHSPDFKNRRLMNWFPLGMLYAFLYFGRYNINEGTSALGKLTDNKAFGIIFTVGAIAYGVSFLINGPLTDRLGGRTTILISAFGAAAANGLIGIFVYFALGGWSPPGGIVVWLSVLYAVNMYFQSFGAVSIVKVNAAWFHVRERGVQGGVFGILISLGIYFGYDWSRKIALALPASPYWVFFVPALVLVAAALVGARFIRDTPGEAGHADFDVGDASSGDTGGERLGVGKVFGMMLKNPIIMTIVAIEFCTGFLRNGVMSWYPKFSKAVGIGDDFVAQNWGMLLCVFGIVGGMFAGVISDRVFGSRRGPVVSVLYMGLSAGAIAMVFTIGYPWVGWVLVVMALNYVGVHGMLSGTASADFGGRKNAGVAVGIIDGFVYAGTGVQSLLVSFIIPTGAAEKVAENWRSWPIAMVPVAVIGLALCTRVWNARPTKAAAAH
ncbi:MAG: MFS transporter, partial [Myxococcaceae bacterium]|nr:MFS transporter [Myxococcaceae bacterium]